MLSTQLDKNIQMKLYKNCKLFPQFILYRICEGFSSIKDIVDRYQS